MVNRNGGMMMKAREKQPGDARPIGQVTVVWALTAMTFLALSCSRHPDAETRGIPESIRVTADLGRPEDGLYLLINTLFVSVPENWFCVQHGGGGGPLPLYKEKQYVIKKNTDTVDVSLIWEEKSFCPYILDIVSMKLHTDKNDRNYLKTILIYVADKNDPRKTVPDKILLKIKEENTEGEMTCYYPNTIDDTRFDLPINLRQIHTNIDIINTGKIEEDR